MTNPQGLWLLSLLHIVRNPASEIEGEKGGWILGEGEGRLCPVTLEVMENTKVASRTVIRSLAQEEDWSFVALLGSMV